MASVNVIVTAHAIFQIRARNIEIDFVREVAMNPQQNVSMPGGRQVRQTQYFDTIEEKTMLLRFLVEAEAGVISVVTAYKTSRLQKYWVE